MVEFKDFVMPFGRYKDKTLEQIEKSDRRYLVWAADNLAPQIRKKIQKFLYDMEDEKDATEAKRVTENIW